MARRYLHPEIAVTNVWPSACAKSALPRESLLTRVHQGLGADSAPRPWVLYGPAGSGKAEAAFAYAARYAADYPVRWWVDGSDPLTVLRDYAALGRILRRSPWPSPDNLHEQAQWALSWMERHGGWLLLLIGANAPVGERLTQWLPRFGGGHVIITSLHPRWPKLIRYADAPRDRRPLHPERVGVPLLLPEEVRARLDPLGVEPNPTAELAELLGQKPLALDLLAKLLHAGVASVRELLPHLQRELLLRKLPDDPAVTGDERAQAALAELVAVALGERGGAVCRLMNALSLLAPATIPLPLLQALSETFFGHEDPTAQLVQRGLAMLDPSGLQVHPLVALAARRYTRELLQDVLVRATAHAQAVFEAETEQTHPAPRWSWLDLWPHLVALDRRACAGGVQHVPLTQLLQQMAGRLVDCGAGEAVRPVLERLLGRLGVDTPSTSMTLLLLRAAAGAASQMSELAPARDYAERALELALCQYGPLHVEVGQCQYLSGILHLRESAYQAALPHFEKALAVAQAVAQPSRMSAFLCALQRARCLKNLPERRCEARAAFEQTLALYEAESPFLSKELAWIYDELAGLLSQQGDAEGALQARQEQLDILLQLYGPKTPWLPGLYWDVASLLTQLRRLPLAIAAYLEGLRCAAACDEVEAELAVQLHWRVGRLYAQCRDRTEARQHFEQALLLCRQEPGALRTFRAILRMALGELAYQDGDLRTARAQYRRADSLIKGHEDSFSAANLALFMVQRAEVLMARGKLTEAQGLASAAIGRLAAYEQPPAEEQARALSLLGQLHKAFGNVVESLCYHRQALAIAEPCLATDHPLLRTLRRELGHPTQNLIRPC